MPISSTDPPAVVEVKRKEVEYFEQICVGKLGPASEWLEESWVSIKMNDGWESRIKITKLKAPSSSARPLIVLFHGGAFNLGTPIQVTLAAREFAQKLGAVVVCPTYKFIREWPWPAPMRSAWEILVYLSKHAETDFGATLLGAGGGFIVGGVSAGASLSAVAAGIFALQQETAESVEQLASPLTGVILHSAVLATESLVPASYRHLWTSREDNKNNPWFDTAQLDAVIESLAADEKSPWFSPLYAIQKRESSEGVKKLRFYLQACQYDPLRDDQVIMHKLLVDKGFASKLDIFSLDVHAAWMAVPFESKSQNPSIGEASIAGIRWLLETE